ncbi:hypothetical protein BH11PSE14_BH11PSE14_10890 [soil metagenome]
MNPFKFLGLSAVCLVAALASSHASAQSTDGYHSIQVFPLVVDTTSFAQRFSFRNPNSTTLTIKTVFYPATNFASQSPQACNDVVIAPGKTATVDSLRNLCLVTNVSSLPAGSQFGYLYMTQTGSTHLPFAAFSRYFNPAGVGASVEAFPAETFTSADLVVNGLRSIAATGGQPTYQTNCFVGVLNETSASSGTIHINYALRDSVGNLIGNAGSLDLTPGKIVRLLDVFAAVGAVGNYNDAQFYVDETALPDPGLISYCTVQDNTSFGADFRIAKQETAAGGQAYPGDIVGAQDNIAARNTLTSVDAIGRTFSILAGANANTHIVYFRHPDFVSCELIDPNTTSTRVLPSYGLEMRLLDPNGLVLAGGNNVTGFGDVYLGDKAQRNGGSNTRYRIEVEDSETNTGAVRAYKLHCQSGSGHTLGDLIRYHDTVAPF